MDEQGLGFEIGAERGRGGREGAHGDGDGDGGENGVEPD